MTLDQLYIIDTINEVGGLSGAAKKLLRSPSAISLNLKNLEDEWGVQIFDRSEYRLRLTREGEEILNKVRPILEGVEALEDYTKSLGNGPEASIRICIDKLFPISKIEHVLVAFKEKFPTIKLYIYVQGKDLPRQTVLNKEADLAITFQKKVEDESFDYLPIYTINMLAVASPTLIGSSDIKIKDLESKTQIIVGEFRKEDIGKSGIQKGDSKWSVTDIATKKSLMLQGLGYGYLPLYLIKEELKSGKLIPIDLMKKGEAPFCIAKNIEMSMGPGKKFLWEFIKNNI
ncbi:MAG: hypothetical protein BM556_18075 [Bacteriovorax sp. MedPE-SWde]|nr:MAG: hypothetical protein BM556_18075 [Bacteriovorax sp. MedPE-SWde]